MNLQRFLNEPSLILSNPATPARNFKLFKYIISRVECVDVVPLELFAKYFLSESLLNEINDMEEKELEVKEEVEAFLPTAHYLSANEVVVTTQNIHRRLFPMLLAMPESVAMDMLDRYLLQFYVHMPREAYSNDKLPTCKDFLVGCALHQRLNLFKYLFINAEEEVRIQLQETIENHPEQERAKALKILSDLADCDINEVRRRAYNESVEKLYNKKFFLNLFKGGVKDVLSIAMAAAVSSYLWGNDWSVVMPVTSSVLAGVMGFAYRFNFDVDFYCTITQLKDDVREQVELFYEKVMNFVDEGVFVKVR